MRLTDYRIKKFAMIGSLVLYATVGISAHWLSAHDEIYPAFSWNLFAYVPQPGVEYTIALTALGNVKYDPPLKFDKLGFLFKKSSESPIKYHFIIEGLARAVLQSDAAVEHTYRGKLEAIFQKTPAQYQVLRVENDPLVFWRSKTYISSSVLAVFDTTKP